ncbi:right-handed parallel beta-helix repeat-containing protein [Streptomyces sp. NPDC088762]|uniref:right-handed parallel beta-helix repeat-containing protein n=1 Tax=Streptomyces sp. NPDC088762 TaxID=3365891 RepID=UPI0037F3D363
MGRSGRCIAVGGMAAACLLIAACDVETYKPAKPAPPGPHTYYLSPDGDDDHDGLSDSRAWRSLARADSVRFKPGDRLRLKAGAVFKGTFTIGKGDAGSAARPVVIESYGGGRATIAAAGTEGIAVYNTAGVEIRDLNLVGDAKAFKERDGINFFSDLPAGRRLDHVRISNVDVSRFQNGIRFGAGKSGSGFRDVRIVDSTVRDNKDAGIVSFGPAFEEASPKYAHERVTVSRVKVYGNNGDPSADDRNSGSGIVLGSIRTGRVEGSVSHDNGANSSPKAQEGPEGIWTYNSTGMVIEKNVSYANHTGSRVDGGGFGLDNNVSSSVLQYNLSFRNDGAGYLVYSSQNTRAHKKNVVRFNLSGDDARKLPWYGGIVAYGMRVSELDIYHNTVVMKANGAVRAPALRLEEGLHTVSVRNNVFATDGAPVVDSEWPYQASRVTFQGNDYFSTGKWTLRWGKGTFTDLASWRAKARQEQRGSDPTGTAKDPCLAGVAAPITDVAKAAAMLVPECAEDVSEGVLDLRSLGIDPGPVDYFGERLSPVAAIGAAEPRTAD